MPIRKKSRNLSYVPRTPWVLLYVCIYMCVCVCVRIVQKLLIYTQKEQPLLNIFNVDVGDEQAVCKMGPMNINARKQIKND